MITVKQAIMKLRQMPPDAIMVSFNSVEEITPVHDIHIANPDDVEWDGFRPPGNIQVVQV